MNYDPTMREKVISFIKSSGPVLPVQISKRFGGNLLFSGAILSELVSKKAIKISNAKVGGSPVYYVNGQESKLEVLYTHLKDVHKKVYDSLKEEKVLKDNELEPWQRVALRELKDFAYPFQREDGIYWRWHLASDGEIKRILDEKFSFVQHSQTETPQETEQPKPEEGIQKEEFKLGDVNTEREENEIAAQKNTNQKEFEAKQKTRRSVAKKEINIGLTNYFSERGATVIEEKVIRKNSEIDYVVDIPSNIGKVRFFVKVRNKKTVNDADIVLAHNEAQLRKLPLLFLSSGEVNKKGEEYLTKNFVVFEKI